MAGPSAAEVDKLFAGSNEALKKLKSINADPSLDLAITNDIESHTKAIKRIEELQRAKAGATSQVRLVRYFQKHGNGIFWIATTGLLFGMAWNRLQEKYEQEVGMDVEGEWLVRWLAGFDVVWVWALRPLSAHHISCLISSAWVSHVMLVCAALNLPPACCLPGFHEGGRRGEAKASSQSRPVSAGQGAGECTTVSPAP